uniref:Glucose-1-phosphate thymidylyltransferase n=1 Tax=candidate division WOR-3 bacterium TaxID=2052148 RepID=A0A7C4GC34_UNCW3
MLCVYEDEGSAGFGPLTDLRPVFDLRCGRRTLLEKLRRLFPREKATLWVREELAEVTAEAHPDCSVNSPVDSPCLFVSGRAILRNRLPLTGAETAFTCSGRVVAFRLNKPRDWRPGALGRVQLDLPGQPIDAILLSHPWDIVELTPAELALELKPGKSRVKLPARVTLVGPATRLSLARDARVWPGVVISTESGPVGIEPRVEIRPGSFIEGPCCIGSGTVIDDARVRPGCSFGPDCRIGGEVEASVFQGFANKHHDGFIGHSFIGEWVNLGALTTCSDLKNAYEPVTVSINGRSINTGLLKVGCFVGDHVKTAIGTLLNTGAVVGTAANWFEPGLSPKQVPAFAWGRSERWPIDAVVKSARQVMSRRGCELTPALERLLRRLFAHSGR